MLWGLAVSLFYLVFLSFLIYPKFSSLHELELNALGDFLAGICSPLTLIWLFFGFWQQKIAFDEQAKKLEADILDQRSRSEALRIQVEQSLRRSEREQDQYLRSIEPRFVLENLPGVNAGGIRVEVVKVTNKGADCYGVKYNYNPGMDAVLFSEFFQHGDSANIQISNRHFTKASPPLEISIEYERLDASTGIAKFSLSVEGPLGGGDGPDVFTAKRLNI